MKSRGFTIITSQRAKITHFTCKPFEAKELNTVTTKVGIQSYDYTSHYVGIVKLKR